MYVSIPSKEPNNGVYELDLTDAPKLIEVLKANPSHVIQQPSAILLCERIVELERELAELRGDKP